MHALYPIRLTLLCALLYILLEGACQESIRTTRFSEEGRDLRDLRDLRDNTLRPLGPLGLLGPCPFL